MLRVYFDSQIFQMQQIGGISRYFVELIKTFKKYPELGIEPVLTCRFVQNIYLSGSMPEKKIIKVKNKFFITLLKLKSVFGLVLIPKSVDIVHHTFYASKFVLKVGNSRTVSTLYDMIPEFEAEYSRRNPHFNKLSYVSKSDSVIAISNSTKNDYEKVAISPRSDLEVVHLGSSFDHDTFTKPTWLPKDYFVYVGNRSGYKNGSDLFEAFANLSNSGVYLLFVGGERPTKTEIEFINRKNLDSRVIFKTVDDSELPSIYSNARALIVTSSNEGFGLPVVEAASYGCPLILSNINVFKEVIEENALFFEPKQILHLSNLMNYVLTDPTDLSLMANRAKLIAKRFTWYKCAYETALLYKKLVANSCEKSNKLTYHSRLRHVRRLAS